jgi:hypothetical protein
VVSIVAKANLEEILRYWAADREGVPVLSITNLKFDFDEGWPGTDVTPGEMPEIIVTYDVTKHVMYRHEVTKLGDFIAELAMVARRGPFPSELRS